MIEQGGSQATFTSIAREIYSDLYIWENIAGSELQEGATIFKSRRVVGLKPDGGIYTARFYDRPENQEYLDGLFLEMLERQLGLEMMATLSAKAISLLKLNRSSVLAAATMHIDTVDNTPSIGLAYPRSWIKGLGDQATAEQMAHHFLTFIPGSESDLLEPIH